MKIIDFINEFKAKKIMNTQIKPNAIGEYLKKELEVRDYVPFVEKQSIIGPSFKATVLHVNKQYSLK